MISNISISGNICQGKITQRAHYYNKARTEKELIEYEIQIPKDVDENER